MLLERLCIGCCCILHHLLALLHKPLESLQRVIHDNPMKIPKASRTASCCGVPRAAAAAVAKSANTELFSWRNALPNMALLRGSARSCTTWSGRRDEVHM